MHQPIVMISSTARDLPLYRDQVKEACLRVQMFPKMMEHLPARDADAIEASLAMVDQADVYIGIFAHRYGYIPEDQAISITQMEYERAVERNIPRLLFLLDDEVPVKPSDFARGEAANKLAAFKTTLKAERVVAFFKNPDDLHARALQSLYDARDRYFATPKPSTSNKTAAPSTPPIEPPEDPLPPLPNDIDLPINPYRQLQWFRREDAGVFFGRNREIRSVYEALTAPWSAPIVLLYGESGVGKSSLLAAGVRPRLETSHIVQYVRRNRSLGLTHSLYQALQNTEDIDTQTVGADAIAPAWHALEKASGKPLVVILDQVEELYTRPLPEPHNELASFLQAVESLFAERNKRPRGRLLLAFRKEWMPEIEQRLTDALLPHQKVFLERLTDAGIQGIVEGPQQTEKLRGRYRLTVQPGLADQIANELRSDTQSPIGPTLSILLSNMWAQVKNDPAPAFTRALYQRFKDNGLHLNDFLDQQLKQLKKKHPAPVDSGLALDVLYAHTTDLGTADTRTQAELMQLYAHCQDDVRAVLQTCQTTYLLVATENPANPEATTYRLAHDTLAPLVRQRYRASHLPGQRAVRILQSRMPDWQQGKTGPALDLPGLKAVERGTSGMQRWTADETRLVNASRNARKLKRIKELAAGGVFLLACVAFFIYQDAQKYTPCQGVGVDNDWCRACIDAEGTYKAEGFNPSTYCVNATAFTSFDLDELPRDFVYLEAGRFPMGSDSSDSWSTDPDEYPRDTVEIESPFWMGKYEVTQAQWYAIMQYNPSNVRGDSLPVTDVSWDSVQVYLNKLNEENGCTSQPCFRLPTEAEWEYAACSGKNQRFGFGNDVDGLSNYANLSERINKIGMRLPNDWGLYDMHGNVWEWTQSKFARYPYVADDGRETLDGDEHRVLRGGAFLSDYYSVRCADRYGYFPLNRSIGVGFRVVSLPLPGINAAQQ